MSADTDALLLSWKLRAHPGKPWPKGSLRLMGWEHTGSELRGHFLGHYLSAVAYSYAATGDPLLVASLAHVLNALEEVAEQSSAAASKGFLSAFPESFLDRLEAITPVWAPYYTIHKVLAGLLNVVKLGDALDAPSDVKRLAATARKLAAGLGDYIDGRVQRLISSKSADHHFATLNQECGGINDGLWQLAALTNDARHKAVASYFDKPCLLGPLAGGKDELTGMHGNTALALVIGAAHRYELTGEAPFAAIAARFFALVDSSRSYVTGGSTHNELWGRPGELGHTLVGSAGGMRFEHVESCTTHNMMRLVEMLLRVSSGGVKYAAWIERALLNGVLGTLRAGSGGVNGTYLRITRRWRARDTMTLTLPQTLALDFLPDKRARYSQMAAVLHGPVVLACILCRQQQMAPPKGLGTPLALLSRISAVPTHARGQLRSLHRPVARGAPAGTIVLSDDLLYMREGELPLPPFRHRRRGATDVAIASTFRELPGLFANEQNLVSFEPLSRPGCFIAAPSPEDEAAWTKQQQQQQQQKPPQKPRPIGTPLHALQLRLVCTRPGVEQSSAEQKACSWRRHDPLVSTAHGSFQSYESASRHGFFMTTFGAEANMSQPLAHAQQPQHPHGDRVDLGGASVQLTPLILAKKPPPPPPKEGLDTRFNPPSAFALESAFEEALGQAEYPQSAFWLSAAADDATSTSALIYPLNEVVDEHYSVYFDFAGGGK